MNNVFESKIKALDSIQEYMNSNNLDLIIDKETPLFQSIGISQVIQVKKIIESIKDSVDISDVHSDIKITFNEIVNEYKKLRGWE